MGRQVLLSRLGRTTKHHIGREASPRSWGRSIQTRSKHVFWTQSPLTIAFFLMTFSDKKSLLIRFSSYLIFLKFGVFKYIKQISKYLLHNPCRLRRPLRHIMDNFEKEGSSAIVRQLLHLPTLSGQHMGVDGACHDPLTPLLSRLQTTPTD